MSTHLPKLRSSGPATGPERFGKYEILRRIASGGMAEIYLARASGIEGFEKLVVLKRILPQYADDEEFVSMFLDEARLAATLHHSNVVQVYDIGAVDGQYFLTMEFLHGQDGRQLMKAVAQRGGALPLEHALSIVMSVCSGLHYAHDQVVDGKPLGLVHRDVSPQNVLITYDGGVKLLDFGIAHATSRLTQTRGSSLKGKVAYMSPEQCGGFPLDRRSDVFSTAILLWELTTGRRLFTGDSDFEVMRKLREDDPPRPSAVSFAYPLALERIVLKGLKRNRDERYASAEEMLLDLEAFAREARLPISALQLSRYMRELFKDQIDAWNRQQRGELEPAAPPPPPGDEVARTETSVPGPAPPVMESDSAVPMLAPRRRGRAWAAVAVGLLVGSLATWIASRPAAPPPIAPAASVAAPAQEAIELPTPPPPPTIARPEAPRFDAPRPAVARPAVASPAVARPAVAKPAVAKPAVARPDVAKPPVRKPDADKLAIHKPAVDKPLVHKPAVDKPAVDKPAIAAPAPQVPLADRAEQRPPPPRRVVRKAPPKLPANWDPESILPP